MLNWLILFIENYFIIIQFLLLIGMLLVSVGIITLIERKILGNLQYRVGPSFTSLFGILQPIMDGFKLYIKESILPILSQEDTYVNATCLSFFLSIFCWIIVPFDYEYLIKDIEVSFLFILAVISLTIYSLILSGWGSNSNYPMIGAIRSASQMISYEISVSMMLMIIFFLFGSIHLTDIVNMQSYGILAIAIFPVFIIFYICGLAEINRLPFDLPEAESELVSGYHTEYSGIAFIYFNIGEYSHVLFLAVLISEFFLGGWISPIFVLSSIFVEEIIYVVLEIIFFVNVTFFIRGLLPRFRYDQLMKLNWNTFIPVIIFFFYYLLGVLLYI